MDVESVLRSLWKQHRPFQQAISRTVLASVECFFIINPFHVADPAQDSQLLEKNMTPGKALWYICMFVMSIDCVDRYATGSSQQANCESIDLNQLMKLMAIDSIIFSLTSFKKRCHIRVFSALFSLLLLLLIRCRYWRITVNNTLLVVALLICRASSS